VLAAGTACAAEPSPASSEKQVELDPVLVQAPEPKFVAPTRRDRIGRIWAPVLIDGKGPFRLVLDTGANRSAVTTSTAHNLDPSEAGRASANVVGFTGSAVVPTIHVDSMEIGDLALGATNLPVLEDVFGGADGVLSFEGLRQERIVADFVNDRLEIARSKGQHAPAGYAVVALRMIDGLPVAEVRIGGVQTKAIIDTGAQLSIGNLALRDALTRSALDATVREDIVGVTQDLQTGDRIASPDMQFGTLRVHGMNIVYGDMYLFQHWHLTDEPALAIGMDMLGQFDVLIIDCARHEMHLRPRKKERQN